MEKPYPETHPLPFFLPENARLLMLGSFPPKQERWCMDFYYPNFQNDMWRIFGLVFFGDKDRFVLPGKTFDKEAIVSLLTAKGIALGDTAVEVVRLKDNASDQFLEITRTVNLPETLSRLPKCEAVVVTGQKAAETFAQLTGAEIPPVGGYKPVSVPGRTIRFYRMPASSRAYPKPLLEKAEMYAGMFRDLAMK